jgi:plasmid stability protein
MASITIRNLDDKLKQRLRMRAAHHGRSMEDEVRDILRLARAEESTVPRDVSVAIQPPLRTVRRGRAAETHQDVGTPAVAAH